MRFTVLEEMTGGSTVRSFVVIERLSSKKYATAISIPIFVLVVEHYFTMQVNADLKTLLGC